MSDALVRRAGTELVALLMAHFLVSGVRIDREAPRGERELHLGEAYAATAQAIPPGPQYVAMGHIHAPQPVPGAPVPAEYAGSPLPLDFGEAGERKRVAIVEVEPGRLATVTSVELAAGRPLVRAQGRWSELEARAEELADAYVDLTVDARDAAPDLADRARERFPFLVRVRAARPAGAPGAPVVEGHRSLPERYADYRREVHGRDPEPELLALFRELLDELDAPV
jgi:exonuclease SbcD